MLRFFFYQALRLNLVLACWNSPEVEATGTELAMESEAQEILRGWLHTPDAHHPDVNPLRGMLAEALVRAHNCLIMWRALRMCWMWTRRRCSARSRSRVGRDGHGGGSGRLHAWHACDLKRMAG